MTGERQKKSNKSGISYLRKAELEKFANSLKNKKQYGGNSHEVSGVNESWDVVNQLLNNSAPLDLGPPRQVGKSGGKRRTKKTSYSLYGGGEQSSGATFLPAQWNTPSAPLPKPNNPSQIESAYGRIRAENIGSDVNLAAFPNSSMQQTGGRPKKDKAKKAKKDAVPKEKPAKKAKKSSKKETSLWEKIKSFF